MLSRIFTVGLLVYDKVENCKGSANLKLLLKM